MLMVDVESTLNDAGYRCRVASYDASLMLFEDDSIFGFISRFEDATELLDGWREKQTIFIQKSASALRRSSLKSWNCYAIFVCTQPAGGEAKKSFSGIEEDLSLTRKVVADGVATQRDIQRAFLPILPIQNHTLATASADFDIASRLETWSEHALLALHSEASASDLIDILLETK